MLWSTCRNSCQTEADISVTQFQLVVALHFVGGREDFATEFCDPSHIGRTWNSENSGATFVGLRFLLASNKTEITLFDIRGLGRHTIRALKARCFRIRRGRAEPA